MQGQQLKKNKIFFLTYPINSYIIFRRREELVGGTRPGAFGACDWCLWAGPTHIFFLELAALREFVRDAIFSLN